MAPSPRSSRPDIAGGKTAVHSMDRGTRGVQGVAASITGKLWSHSEGVKWVFAALLAGQRSAVVTHWEANAALPHPVLAGGPAVFFLLLLGRVPRVGGGPARVV